MAETIKKSNNLSGSVGAGMKSLFAPGGRRYYVLEHKLSTAYHKAGEKQEIIIDYIELGRDSKCQVRFDESQKTVSRRHAAIFKNGDNWKIRNLSTTNQTLLNGNPVGREWYLQNGDDIQLSVGGPKIGFLIPVNNTMGSIGLSRRMSLFRKQALKPYKTAMAVMSIVFILGLGGLGGYIWKQSNDIDKIVAENAVMANTLIDFKGSQDSLISENAKNKEMQENLRRRLEVAISSSAKRETSRGNGGDGQSLTPTDAINACMNDVYYIVTTKVVGVSPDGEEEELEGVRWSGTGFLLDDGRFVTAGHVAESWRYFTYSKSESDIFLNAVANNGGRVVVHFRAYSKSGRSISFKSTDFVCDRRNDESLYYTDEDENQWLLKAGSLDDGSDWAYINTSMTGGLSFDSELSTSMAVNSTLSVLGFPYSMGVNERGVTAPIYSECKTSMTGTDGGIIRISSRNFDSGNSGGPAFMMKDDKLVVVGIVSASSGQQGVIVPIANAR